MCSCTTVIWFTGGDDDIRGFNSLPSFTRGKIAPGGGHGSRSPHRTLSDVRMTDQMNVSLVNNGEKQCSVRSEDHEALRLVEMERSPVSK